MMRWLKPFARLPVWLMYAFVRNGQNVATALVQIWANKGRSILTTLGIIIAVTSIITVVSFVQGFGDFVTRMVRGYGTQFMVVRPYTPPERQRAGLGRVTLDLSIRMTRRWSTGLKKLRRYPFAASRNITS